MAGYREDPARRWPSSPTLKGSRPTIKAYVADASVWHSVIPFVSSHDPTPRFPNEGPRCSNFQVTQPMNGAPIHLGQVMPPPLLQASPPGAPHARQASFHDIRLKRAKGQLPSHSPTTTKYHTRIHISSDIRSVNSAAPRNNSKPPVPAPSPGTATSPRGKHPEPIRPNHTSGQGRKRRERQGRLHSGLTSSLQGRENPVPSVRAVVVVVVAPLHKQNTQESLGSRAGSPNGPPVGEIIVFNRPW